MVLLIIASLCLLLASKNGSLDCSAPAHYVLMLGNERRPRPGKIGPTFAQQTQNMLHKRQKDIKFFFCLQTLPVPLSVISRIGLWALPLRKREMDKI